MIIERRSPFSGQMNSMDLPITQDQIKKYYDGALIQNAFPNLTPGQREFLMTGITEQEWEETFGSEE